MQEARITLSSKKCHSTYTSILLLGQKVSHLGLSTHAEKVKAITELATPANVCTLQSFLGMVVYFSHYIPGYASLAAPLFKLLKKKGKVGEGKRTGGGLPEHTESTHLCSWAGTPLPCLLRR